MPAIKQLLSEEEKSRVTFYPEHDFIPVLEPDPPYVRIPSQNEKFLAKHFTPIFRTHTCPFCKSKVETTGLGSRTWSSKMQPVFKEWGVTSKEGDVTLYVCPSCGWWAVLQTNLGWQEIEEHNYAGLIDLVAVHWAKMKTLDVAAAEFPLKYLRDHIAQNAKKMSQIPQGHLVDLMRSCFCKFFDCDIIQVGEAVSDAYDTFLVKAETPLLIRVNRKDLESNDSVQVIHDVLGVVIVKNQCRGLRIGLTKRFAEDIERTGVLPVLQNEGITISLNDYESVLEIVKRPVYDSAKPWYAIW